MISGILLLTDELSPVGQGRNQLMSKNSGMVLIGGMWLNTSQNGNKYMSGRMGLGGKLLLFKNNNKRSDTDPDYMLFIAQWEKPGEDDGVMSDVEF